MTGDWEAKLNRIEKGDYNREAFMNEIVDFTEDVVVKVKAHLDKMLNMVFPDLEVTCPGCVHQDSSKPIKLTNAEN